jgi:hypothetical protein
MTVTYHLEQVPAARYRDLVRFHVSIPQLDSDFGDLKVREIKAVAADGHGDASSLGGF